MEREPGSLPEEIRRDLNPENMMDKDSWNVFMSLRYVKRLVIRDDNESREKLSAIQPLPTYEEYITNTNNEEHAKLIMQYSSPEAVQKFNELISEFNDNREEIIKTKDVDKIDNILLQAGHLIYNK